MNTMTTYHDLVQGGFEDFYDVKNIGEPQEYDYGFLVGGGILETSSDDSDSVENDLEEIVNFNFAEYLGDEEEEEEEEEDIDLV